MLQQNLNKKAKMAHVVNLLSIAFLDGKITEDEKKLVLKISKELGLTDEEFQTCLKTADAAKGHIVCEPPTSDQEKAAFLKNMVLMMMIDGKCSESEIRYIKVLAEKFGYDGEKTIKILVDKINNEFKQVAKQNQQEQYNPDANLVDSDKAQIRKQVAKGKEALLRHDIREAFNQLFIPAHLDAEAQRLFLSITTIPQRMHQISQSQINVAKEYSDKGYSLSQYVYARYLQLYKPEEKSLEEARKLLEGVRKAGMGDATCLLAEMLLYGNFGLVDLEMYHKMVNEAMDKGSNFANCKRLSEMVHGEHGIQAQPGKAIELIKEFLNGNESDDPGVVMPYYYEILGDAYRKVGDKRQAEHYYRKAINMGHYEAYSNYCLLMSCDDDDNIVDQAVYDRILKAGCDHKDPECILIRGDFPEEEFDALDPTAKKNKHERIQKDLQTAFEMGNGYAAYLFARNYYIGYNGFEEHDEEAWKWLVRGTRMESAECYAMLADMVEDGHMPDDFDTSDDFMEYCQLSALRRGDDSQLKNVVNAYKSGKLTPFAKEIEKYYVPKFESLPETDDDEEDDDDREGVYIPPKVVGIVNTDGVTDIFELDAEYFDELPPFIAADRLDAVRVKPLYDLSKKLGFKDHIVGWVDSMGLIKDLPDNPVGCRIYPGRIAGDLILTLEDDQYHPKSFEGVEELKEVIKALGSKVGRLCLDDAPDDDGRYDGWS